MPAIPEQDRAKFRDELQDAYHELTRVVEALDRMELHHAAAYVGMALDILQEDHPELPIRR